jgi:hypothetical protein
MRANLISVIELPRMVARPAQSVLVPFTRSTTTTTCIQGRRIQARSVHSTTRPKIPPPTPFVPDPQTFLTLIGRGLSQHAPKIPTWRHLFSLDTEKLKEIGVESPRSRRYLLEWLEKFRLGQYGIGGDLKNVDNGVAELRIVEVHSQAVPSNPDTLPPKPRKIVVNWPAGAAQEDVNPENLVMPRGMGFSQSKTMVTGRGVTPMTGRRRAKLAVIEGLWEDRLGHKIDGGERRQAQVRAKRWSEERAAAAR